MEIVVTGGENLARLSKQMRGAGKELRAEVSKEIRSRAKPLGKFIAVSAGSALPHRGGLGYSVAGSSVTVAGGINSSGTIRTTIKIGHKKYGLTGINRGRLRHPVFGNRDVWVTQQVTPGVFTKPFYQGKPTVYRGIENALNKIARRLD